MYAQHPGGGGWGEDDVWGRNRAASTVTNDVSARGHYEKMLLGAYENLFPTGTILPLVLTVCST